MKTKQKSRVFKKKQRKTTTTEMRTLIIRWRLTYAAGDSGCIRFHLSTPSGRSPRTCCNKAGSSLLITMYH